LNYLVTGASGQLGSCLMQKLREHGHVVIPTSRSELNSSSILESLIKNFQIGTIVNCAAWTNVDSAEINRGLAKEANAGIVENLAKLAKKNSVTFAQVSTDYVFSGNSDRPYKPGDKCEPVNYYGYTKYLGERFALDIYPENSYVIRTAWLYSPYGNSFFRKILAKANEGDSVSVVDSQKGQPTLVDDLAMQMIQIITKGLPPSIYHVTNSGETSWYDYAVKIYELSGHDVSLVLKKDVMAGHQTVTRPSYSVLDNSSHENHGLLPLRNWERALSETVTKVLIDPTGVKLGD